jgi:hypothetical protein
LPRSWSFPNLKAEKEYYRLGVRSFEPEVLPRVPKEGDHAVMDDLDELLARVDRAEHGLALRVLDGAVDEPPHDAKVNVGLEKRHLDFLDGLLDIFLGDARLAGHPAGDVGERSRNPIEHG